MWHPMLDAGIGREAGYENDEALRAAVREERSKMPPPLRAAVEDAERDILRRFLFGDTPR